MKLYPRFFLLAILACFLIITFSGCGSVSSKMPSPTPTPTPTPTPPGATPTPTPTPGNPSPTPTPSPSPTPTPTPSAASITGRVVDPSGVPVVGTVIVALELSSGDFHTVQQVNADAQGNFQFNNVQPIPSQSVGYAIMVAARAAHDPGTAPGSPGSFYAPALLLPGGTVFGPTDPIVPGTNVGTITLRFTSQGDIDGTVTSTDSTQTVPVPIKVQLPPMRVFTRDFVFDYPWVNQPAPFNTQPGASCPAGTACASFILSPVPTDPVEEAVFSKSGYTFSPSQSGANFEVNLNAFSLLNGQPDCNPNNNTLFANGLKSDSPNNVGPAAFTSCQ